MFALASRSLAVSFDVKRKVDVEVKQDIFIDPCISNQLP